MQIRLKQVMKRRGVTGRELAERMGSTPQYISNIASGRQSVSLKTLEELSALLGVPIWEFFASSEEVSANHLIAFFHYKGNSHTPTEMGEMMTIMRSWREEEFVESCRIHAFSHIRERFADNEEIQQAMDTLCRLLSLDCKS